MENTVFSNKILDLSKLKAFAHENLNMGHMKRFVLAFKHNGKKRKCWQPPFSPLIHNVFDKVHSQVC